MDKADQVRAAQPLPAAPGALTALTQAPLGIAIFDRDMRYLAASHRYLIDQGLPGDTPLVGRVHYDVFPEVPRKWREVHAQVIRDGVELSHEADPYERSDGQTEWIRWSVSPWRDETGEIGGLVLYTEVVTPSVEARLRLEAAERRYRAVFDQAAVGVARVSPGGRFLELNDRFCTVAGWSRGELERLTFQEITHPDDLDTDVAQVEAVLAGELDTYSLDKRYLTRDGAVTWVRLTVALVRTPTGEPDYFVSVIEDINARKAAEAEQERYQAQLRLLIHELNHRVKNTLATVQSMAAQTLRREAETGAGYAKFESRLMSLAEVHDVLTRERWHGAALAEVAERAVRPFAAAGRVTLEGPAVWLQPRTALTLALVFHELATNAVKYGALSADGGRIELTWSLDAAGEELRLVWTERGGPRVVPPRRKGFGSRLIARSFASELKGAADMRYEPDGFSCAMTAHLAASLPMLGPDDLVNLGDGAPV